MLRYSSTVILRIPRRCDEGRGRELKHHSDSPSWKLRDAMKFTPRKGADGNAIPANTKRLFCHHSIKRGSLPTSMGL